MTAKLILWEILCGALFWSVFCRSVRTDRTTKLDIRVVLLLVGLGSLLGLGAPLYGWEPDSVTILIIASIVAMQVVTAEHWVRRVPEQFIDTHFLDPRQHPGDKP